ncbi:uncharacterized protein I303_101309 [Kwoniella dejecticola CBS 10117]|uniref:Zn(2)-C6 fungal-type domain-containing protein n=1 Tax=Kwoniella dejecticola CBS 10117 TaxID=1296121 RepID=A0A1A6AHD8_9TREE|nr:uncharacterized protein I303_01317 [Kwoniella dejecticola CBS 10117]OBR89490.1 hypothetical protein I303_01317 [Kwoniella dejecticola CBS 10117]
MPPSDTIREPTACLRCRQRKIKCLGPVHCNASDGLKSCEKCLKNNVKCEFVPHKRGRKVGTKLSDDVKASLKEKYALSQQRKLGTSISRREQADRGQSNEKSPVDQSAIGQERGSSSNRSSEERYTSTVHQLLPTSSIRVNYAEGNTINENGYDDQNQVNGHEQHDGDIGPSITKISSISRLFTIKKPQDNHRLQNNFSLYREDPITCGYIDEANGRRLFDLFMDKLSARVFIFDPTLHTYDYVRNSSNFLFCVMLAIAAKFDTSTPPIIHKKCLALAKDQLLRVFADNIESEETVQALYVLTEYKEAEDEKSYILLGMACRIAVDLDLARPRPDYDERRNRNRQRIWLVLYAADRRYNYCGQTAKPCMMPESSLSRDAFKFIESPICLVIDYRLGGNVVLRRLLAAHIEAIDRDNELNQGRYSLDVGAEYREMEKEADDWTKKQIMYSEPEMAIHAHLSALHAKVIIAHRWVQRLFRSDQTISTTKENQEREKREALGVCINGSLGILNVMLQLSDDTLRYACDSKHLYFAYASFFLHKIFDTNIASVMLDRQYIAYFINLFERCADRLEQVTVSPTLTGAFHAAFLRSLAEICAETLKISNNRSASRVPSRRTSIDNGSHSLSDIANLTGHTQFQSQTQTEDTVAEGLQTTYFGQPEISKTISNDNPPIPITAFPQADQHIIDPILGFGFGINFDSVLDNNMSTAGSMVFDPFAATVNSEDVLDTNLNMNISWNDWWPFDNQFLTENTNNLGQFDGDLQDWQGSMQAS